MVSIMGCCFRVLRLTCVQVVQSAIAIPEERAVHERRRSTDYRGVLHSLSLS